MLEVGRIGRPHGTRGEVTVTLTSNRAERVEPGAVLHTDNGRLVVRASRPHKHAHLVSFEGIATRDAAEQLRGQVVRAEPIDDADELWVHDLIGSRVIDRGGVDRGVVEAVVANPASDLLELAGGALVPITFVVEIDGPIIRVDVPDGLFTTEES